MYLKRLYKYHKGWLLFVVVFVAAQLFITFKAGVTATPFLYYSMYSEITPVRELYPVTNIIVNGEALKTRDFSPLQWDNTVWPAICFEMQERNNREWWERDIRRLLPMADPAKYFNALSPQEFQLWYTTYLEKKLGYPVYSIDIEHATYIYNRYGFNKNLNPLPPIE